MKRYIFVPVLSLVILFVSAGCKKGDDSAAVDPRCRMSPEPGMCMAAIVRYYWDPVEKKCKPFTWGGCGPFPFITMDECNSCGCDAKGD